MGNGDISAINLPDVSMDRMEFEQFQLIENDSNEGKAVLLSNIGFKYTLSRKTKTTSYWRCYKQAKPNVCPGTVRQKGEIYLTGNDHNNYPAPGLLMATKVCTAKLEGDNHKFELPINVVDRVVESIANVPDPINEVPGARQLTRRLTYRRRKTIPKHPAKLDFILNNYFIPSEFLIADITRNAERHLIFGTSDMRKLLLEAEHWFMDGTFKVVRTPFVQLFSIHAFVRRDNGVKQVPLFVLMSKRTAKDYSKIFQYLKDMVKKGEESDYGL